MLFVICLMWGFIQKRRNGTKHHRKEVNSAEGKQSKYCTNSSDPTELSLSCGLSWERWKRLFKMSDKSTSPPTANPIWSARPCYMPFNMAAFHAQVLQAQNLIQLRKNAPGITSTPPNKSKINTENIKGTKIDSVNIISEMWVSIMSWNGSVHHSVLPSVRLSLALLSCSQSENGPPVAVLLHPR